MIALRRNEYWRRLWRWHQIVATLEEPFDSGRRATPKDVTCLWNKGPAIWFPWCAGKLQSLINSRARRLDVYSVIGHCRSRPLRRRNRFGKTRDWTRARGDERLSANKRTESDGVGAFTAAQENRTCLRKMPASSAPATSDVRFARSTTTRFVNRSRTISSISSANCAEPLDATAASLSWTAA